MFIFFDKRSCVNQTVSFFRAAFWVWFGLVSLVPLLGSSAVLGVRAERARDVLPSSPVGQFWFAYVYEAGPYAPQNCTMTALRSLGKSLHEICCIYMEHFSAHGHFCSVQGIPRRFLSAILLPLTARQHENLPLHGSERSSGPTDAGWQSLRAPTEEFPGALFRARLLACPVWGFYLMSCSIWPVGICLDCILRCHGT